jgi:hypothetical protein
MIAGFFTYVRRVFTVFPVPALGTVVLCLIYIWLTEPLAVEKRKNTSRNFTYNFKDPSLGDATKEEHRIAEHFTADTLPGLIKLGLVKKYERRGTGTLLLVDGKIWKKRSRFFKESLLAEMAVYNRVKGFAAESVILDDRSHQLYARVLPEGRKEIYD